MIGNARRRAAVVFGALLTLAAVIPPPVFAETLAAEQANARRIREAISENFFAHERLQYLCDTFGSRITGSRSLERAVDWIIDEARKDGFAPRGEKVMVAHWVRGEESLELEAPRRLKLPMLGLGGSVRTPPEGIAAPVKVVSSLQELEEAASEVRGKIVLLNVPFSTYEETVHSRVDGPSKAARAGALAVLVRSVTPLAMRLPHTGMLKYRDDAPKIPAAAVTLEDAELLARLEQRGESPTVRLRMNAERLADTESRNVVFEIRGRERPEEIVIMGGHIDSWDVGQGAQDDAGGALAAWHALRAIKRLGLQPRRTLRVVLWTSEENGGAGSEAYAEAHKHENHVLAIESDEGTFQPRGFAFEGSSAAEKFLQEKMVLLADLGATELVHGFSGADVQPLRERFGTPGLGLTTKGNTYFHFHHSEADTADKVSPGDLNACSAALGIMAYAVADAASDLPERVVPPASKKGE